MGNGEFVILIYQVSFKLDIDILHYFIQQEKHMEQWKPIKNYEGFYEISNTGKIKSLVNRYKTKQNAELLPYVDKKGYHRITLSKPTKGRFLVHRLVAEHFLDTVEGCDIVNHKDNNPSNNIFTNLEWTTYSGNLQHAQNQGRLFEAQSKGGKATAAIATKALLEITMQMHLWN